MISRSLLVIYGWKYRLFIKPLLFLQNPEKVHERITRLGERMGASSFFRWLFSFLFVSRDEDPRLRQERAGIHFRSPIGLAAGFDYEARLPRILPHLGFGFGTVGTLTHMPYEGNPGPMLGRLPRSKALLVNKGFKNSGVKATLAHLGTQPFLYPVGVSIGKTNTETITTQDEARRDVISAFQDAEASGVPFSYYELNISCPNLKGSVDFYHPEDLESLLREVNALSLSRPVWVKMPIVKSNDEIDAMLDVIMRFECVKAVIFGNLQKDRNHPTLIQEEVQGLGKGNLSGAPCKDRSDELIQFAYRKCKGSLFVVGCGGVFSAEDAYRKIRLGASLVQMITGLIFEGPQIVALMNHDISRWLARDGFSSIEEAVGTLS